MTTYSIRITAGEATYHFHTPSVAQVRELFAGSKDVRDFTIWADSEELDRMQSARLAYGQLAFSL
jgi:hypothetical protein